MTFTEQMDKAAESSLAKLFFRLGTPLAIAVGVFLFQQLDGRVAQVSDDVIEIRSDVRYVNARLDERVIRTVDAQGRRLDGHGDRIRILESEVQVLKNTVRTP